MPHHISLGCEILTRSRGDELTRERDDTRPHCELMRRMLALACDQSLTSKTGRC
jgi:hypothetical protein